MVNLPINVPSSPALESGNLFFVVVFFKIYFCFYRVTYRRSSVANLFNIVGGCLDYICFAVRKGSMG